MKDKELFAILILNAPIAFALSFAIGTFLGFPRTEPFYFTMTFGLIYYVLVILGFLGTEWLSKGGTVRNQIRKTFRLKKLALKKSGLAEFFKTDFTVPERLPIFAFVSGLAISLGTWIFTGLIEYEWIRRVTLTAFAFIGSSFGVWYLTLDMSIRYYKEIRAQETRKLKTLDLESSGLSEFSFAGMSSVGKLQRINLGINELKTIDLSPLTGSTRLVELILYFNRLETIDLSPLTSCPNLEYLDLASNNLETIDLTPLSSCVKLSALNLGGNETSTIDLSPLSECKDLKILTIDCMKLKEVNLEPLEGCRKLEFLKLNDNEIESLDITPLFECGSLTDFEIDKVELTTTLNREIEDWPIGVRKHRKRFRKS